jgi:arylformamidase
MSRPWIDVTVPLRSGMVHWPGDPPVSIERIMKVAQGDEANLSLISMGNHTGTHMDPPLHYFDGSPGLDQMPLEIGIGAARVIDIDDPRVIDVPELARHAIAPGERVLFKTVNSACCWTTDEFVENYVAISPAAARYLVDRGVQLVGVDYLSVGSPDEQGAEVHRILLAGGIWILEGLNLAEVTPGAYELICLPLKIADADGAPTRVILRRLD